MFEDRIQEHKARKKIIEEEIEEKKKVLFSHEEEKEAIQEARIVLQVAAKETQENIEAHISNLVTKAIHIVFDDPYIFQPEFVERRNKTECDFWLVQDNEKYRPQFSVGGGVMDIIAFALRLAYWRLENSAPIIILDEPFKNLSKTLIPKAAETLRFLSNELSLQMIITTHIKEITEQADKVFSVKQGNVLEEN